MPPLFFMKCKDCKFYDLASPDTNYGECRFYPPSHDRTLKPWPMVYADEWCGKFSARHVDKTPI